MHLRAVLTLAAFALACALLLANGALHAQTYPSKPVRVIVPFPPGGPADVLARLFAEKLSAAWNQPIVVDNRAGAGGNVGSELTAKASADGYTLLLAASSHVSNAALYSNLPYDAIRDFAPISQVAYYSLVLVVHRSVPATNLKELIALAKANPGKLTVASAGTGTPTHLAAELFRAATGVEFVHVPYKGAAPATNDLLGGHVQLMFNNPLSAMPHVRTGQLRALATTGAKRAAIAPDVPTVAELGYPGFEVGTWYAFLAPAGVPKNVLGKINADVVAALQSPDLRSRFAAQGIEPVGTSSAQLASIMRSDLDKWSKLIRSANIKPE